MRAALASFAVVATAVGCASFTTTAAPPTDTPDSGVVPAPTVDAGQKAPPGMVLVDKGYAIDALEVTVAQWSAFKSKHADDTGIQRTGRCQGLAFGPASNCTPSSDPTKPQTCVTWCDAEAFCNAAGKRLCGRIGGGPITNDGDANNPDKDQWARACAGEQDTARYPYGAGADGSKCNTQEKNSGGMVAVGTTATCEGGLPGLFDMSGNANEWEDGCYDNSCNLRGGSYQHNTDSSRCDTLVGTKGYGAYFDDVSFRCCQDL